MILENFHINTILRGWIICGTSRKKSRAAVLQSFESLQKVKDARPGLFALQLVLDSKREEIIDIFSEGSSIQKNQAEEIMKSLDPAHTSEYNEIGK